MAILSTTNRLNVGLVGACACAVLLTATLVRADTERTAADYAAEPAAMLEAYRHVEVASVSDAAEQLLHQKRYMSHHMRPIVPAKFAGTALTVKLVRQDGADSAALNGMLEAIDRGGKDSVYVMQIEDGDDVAGMGGLMGTVMYSRGYAGAVIGGGVRDLPQLTRINFRYFQRAWCG
jgi:regulator of RNase E activity RraA